MPLLRFEFWLTVTWSATSLLELRQDTGNCLFNDYFGSDGKFKFHVITLYCGYGTA